MRFNFQSGRLELANCRGFDFLTGQYDLRARPQYDADALSFFARSGVSTPAAKAALNGYIKGLKSLGDWNNVIDGAPLSARLNKGNSTDVPTFKAAKTFTLISGPMWATESINTTSGRIDFPAICSGLALGDQLSIILVANFNGKTYPAIPDACVLRGEDLGAFVVGAVRDQAMQNADVDLYRTCFNGTGGPLIASEDTTRHVYQSGWKFTRADSLYSYQMDVAIDGIAGTPSSAVDDGTPVGIRRNMYSAINQNIDYAFVLFLKNPVATPAQHYALLRSTLFPTL